MKKRVLVVAGDLSLRARIAQILQPAGYAVELAAAAARTRDLLESGGIDAAIVAPSSLGADGQMLVGELQDALDRVIVLSGEADANAQLLDRLSGLWTRTQAAGADQGSDERLAFEGGIVDISGRAFHDAGGREVPLTRAEFQLLVTFLRRPGRVLSRDQLHSAVAGRSSESYDRSVDMLVARLRRKIEPDPKSPRFVLTVPGEGYKFAARPERTEALPASPGDAASERVTSPLERRHMTVLACQVGGLAPIAATHDPEDLHAAMSRVEQAVADVVGPLGGKMVRTPGDTMLVDFGYPQAQEDDAERAVRAALELVRAVPNVDVGLSTALHARVGVASGVLLVSRVESPHDPSATGEALNLAQHLRSVAPENAVVIAASTRELLGSFFHYQALGGAVLEGQPIPAWLVTGESSAGAGRFDALRRAGMLQLVGRDEQLELLLRRWYQAQRGAGQVVVLTGEPGIGKSRLAAELEERVSAEPHASLKYFGLPHQADASMSTIIGELHHACGLERSEPASENLHKLESALRSANAGSDRNISLIADLLSLPRNAGGDTTQLSPQERKTETFSALLARIRGLAERQPLLVIVEDAHWIDPASLEFLALLVERVATLPALMLVTARPGVSAPWIGHAHVMAMELPPLGRKDAELLLKRVASERALSPETMDQILAPTEGVPLFIEELTKSVLETSVLRATAGDGQLQTIPSTLHGSLLARLDRLGAGRDIAQIGAAIGREFSHELLRAVAAMPEPALNSALDRLSNSQLVHRRGTPPLAAYTFKHALVRDAAYGMLSRARRMELHGAIARALESGFPEITEAQPELLAHHYKAADNPAKAVGYLTVAGERALSRSALTEAHNQIAQALQLISRLPDNDARRRDELKLQIALSRTLLEQKGYADKLVGDAYARASDLLERVDDAGMRLAAHYGLWAHHYIGGKAEAMLRDANEFLASARRQDEPGSIMTAYRLLGTAHLINGDIEQANAALDEALARYDAGEYGAESQSGQALRARFGQDAGVTVHSYRSWARWLSGWPEQAGDAAGYAEEKGRASGHAHSLLYALWHAGMANILLRNEAEVARLGAELSKLADERALPYWQALGNFLRGWHAAQSGRAPDAIEMLRQGLELWTQTGSRVFRPICLAFLADAYALGDQPELARATFEEALSAAAETGERWAEPEIHRLFGDLLVRNKSRPSADAIARYERAIAVAQRQGSRSFELRATMSLVRTLNEQARMKDLRKIYRTFTEGLETPDLVNAGNLLGTGET